MPVYWRFIGPTFISTMNLTFNLQLRNIQLFFINSFSSRYHDQSPT